MYLSQLLENFLVTLIIIWTCSEQFGWVQNLFGPTEGQGISRLQILIKFRRLQNSVQLHIYLFLYPHVRNLMTPLKLQYQTKHVTTF